MLNRNPSSSSNVVKDRFDLTTTENINWHAMPAGAVAKILKTSFDDGLGSKEVIVRRQIFGSNKLNKVAQVTIIKRIYREVVNPLVLVLVGALLLTVFLSEWVNAIVIAVAIIVNVVIALYQEGRAKDIFNTLDKQQALNARARRDSYEQLIPAEDLVPGDIVFLDSGKLIPADIRIIDGDQIQADESALTGEWEPVEKDCTPVSVQAGLADRLSMLYSGTLLAGGSAIGVVIATGSKTEFGALAKAADVQEELTPLQIQLNRLARVISVIILSLSSIILVIGLFRGMAFSDILLISLAIAVSAIPAELPSAITAILAVGMRHILERDGLVKNLLAAETLGATDIIICDKTGTLTEGLMTVVALMPAHLEQAPQTDEIKSLSDSQEILLRSALLCSDGFVTTDDNGNLLAHGRPVEKALVEAGLRLGFDRSALNNDDVELDFMPFASERRFAAVLVEGSHGHYAILSGAPEYMVNHATFFHAESGNLNVMKDTDRARLSGIQSEMASRGHRLTGVARVAIEAHKFDELNSDDILKSLGKKLEFLGYISYTDPVRGDVPRSIRQAIQAGTRVIVATGDNPVTALAIATQAGVTSDGKVVEGSAMANLDDEQIYELFKSTSVFARMRPIQKQRLAQVLQSRGHVVAMTGDGINDAPALARADVGIAVHSGTDVAKSAADLILLKNSFSTIVAAIGEGRRLLDNIRRAVVHRISSGFGEVFLVITALILVLPIPILPKQILWVNIIQGGLLTFAYAFEPADSDVMKRKPNQLRSNGIINTQVKKLLRYSSCVFGSLTVFTYVAITFSSDISIEQLRTVMFAILTINMVLFSLVLKDFNNPIWKIDLSSNKYLLFAAGSSLTAFLVSMFFAPLRDFLSLTSLSFGLWLIIATAGIGGILLMELAKFVSKES